MAVPLATAARLEAFCAAHPELPTPFLVLDLDVVADRYVQLRSALPRAVVHYAVKANPHPAVLRVLADLGSSFDVASIGEIEDCLALGIPAARLSYGNTVKKERDIAAAYTRGVRVFAADCDEELGKIRRVAPGSTVLVRIATDGQGADWPLSRKFGCSRAEAERLLLAAARAGLTVGVGFHVGSQQRDPRAWEAPLAGVRHLRDYLAAHGHRLSTVNLGGGLPSNLLPPTPPVHAYGSAIDEALCRHLAPLDDLQVMVEPGRYLVGDAGRIRTEVVLTTDKQTDAGRRWVYLDVGVFSGLAETQDEAIRYPLRCTAATGTYRPAVLAGPTCDSVDVLYEREPVSLPEDVAVGDYVDILSTGAYTTSYSSIGFNGFPPLPTHVLPLSGLGPPGATCT